MLLPLSAGYVLLNKQQPQGELGRLSAGRERIRVIGIAVLMGVYCGFYGPASGTFLMLLLFAVAKMPLTESNCTTKIINLTTNLAAIVVFFQHDAVLVQLGLTVGLFNMLGCYFGARYFVRKAYSGTRYIIILVLTVCFFKILFDLL